MKRLLLPLALLALLAAPAFAQGQQGSQNVAGTAQDDGAGMVDDLHHHRHRGGGDDPPVAPVPEPGTMALASMGLIALGAAVRKRRGK
jgi:PEP-CTERM motif